MKKIILAALVAALAIGNAFAQTTTKADNTKTMPVTSSKSIYETIRKDTNLSQFSQTKDLSSSLSGQGPYTVFAPSNTLYGTGAAPSFYIVSGRNLTMADLHKMNGQTITTSSGQILPVEVKADQVWIGGVQMSSTGTVASNGTVYMFNSPMTAMPKASAPAQSKKY